MPVVITPIMTEVLVLTMFHSKNSNVLLLTTNYITDVNKVAIVDGSKSDIQLSLQGFQTDQNNELRQIKG